MFGNAWFGARWFGDAWFPPGVDAPTQPQPAIEGPWRRLTGEYPPARKRRQLEPAPVLFPPPLPAPAPAAVPGVGLRISNADLRVVRADVELEVELAIRAAGDLVASNDPRETRRADLEAEVAIALLLAG